MSAARVLPGVAAPLAAAGGSSHPVHDPPTRAEEGNETQENQVHAGRGGDGRAAGGRARGCRAGALRQRLRWTEPRGGQDDLGQQSNQTYAASNVNDGNQASYWESANNAFPQWVQVDLGSATSIDQVVLKLPSGWGARTETAVGAGQHRRLQLQHRGRLDRVRLPGNSNVVTVNFGATSDPVRAAERHREHRLAGRAALRVRDLRRDQPRRATWRWARRCRPAASRRPTSRPTPTTATRPATGRAPTTPSRSGCRSTSARR